jgi:hypothetical protein
MIQEIALPAQHGGTTEQHPHQDPDATGVVDVAMEWLPKIRV